MGLQFFLLFLLSGGLLLLVVLYGIKMGTHMQYLRLKDRKDPGTAWDFFQFTEPGLSAYRKSALWIFPLLFPVELDETREELNQQKQRIKNINIAIYAVLMVLLLAAVYAAKAFPEGIV
jgi:hypothetical protein